LADDDPAMRDVGQGRNVEAFDLTIDFDNSAAGVI
jgi:hypothetical protein